ncbi:hypothetical protein ACWDG9_16125 [Streptomyces sp. NPDC001073]
MRVLAERGMLRRYGRRTQAGAAWRQLDHELPVISELSLPRYFLIVEDLCWLAREADIWCQGRGSAANSVMCFALGITQVDPIARELLFERFLNRLLMSPLSSKLRGSAPGRAGEPGSPVPRLPAAPHRPAGSAGRSLSAMLAGVVNQPRPLGPISSVDIADRVALRHRHGDAGLADPPGPDDLLGLIGFMRDRHAKLMKLDDEGTPVPDIAARHVELDEALRLTRLAHQEVDRLQLSLLNAARAAGMTTKQRGRPLGLGSRQGILDREEALRRTLEAAAKYVPVNALDDEPEPVNLAPAAVRVIAEDLVAHWDDLLTDDEGEEGSEDGENSWMAGLATKMRDLTELGIVDLSDTDVASIVTMVREVLEEIDEQALVTGQPAAGTVSALAALQQARRLGRRRGKPGPGEPEDA